MRFWGAVPGCAVGRAAICAAFPLRPMVRAQRPGCRAAALYRWPWAGVRPSLLTCFVFSICHSVLKPMRNALSMHRLLASHSGTAWARSGVSRGCPPLGRRRSSTSPFCHGFIFRAKEFGCCVSPWILRPRYETRVAHRSKLHCAALLRGAHRVVRNLPKTVSLETGL